MMSGWVILDKPSDMTSRAAGGRIARMFGVKKFGHLGTLDPMASGVLPIALGDATKMIPYLEPGFANQKPEIRNQKLLKEYLFKIKWGLETDTGDIMGKITGKNGNFPKTQQIELALPQIIGEIEQIPPAYSAIHINGVRAYDLARRGIPVEMPKRAVYIHELSVEKAGVLDDFLYKVVCSAGTYVRSISQDIARLLGPEFICTTSMIRRTYNHGVDIKDAHPLDFLEKVYNNDPAGLQKYLHPADFGLDDILVTELGGDDAVRFQNGGFIATEDNNVGPRRVYCDGRFVGIGRIDNHLLKPKRIIKE